MALVLIVDDSPTEVHVMQKALEQHGFQTASAADGAEAMRKAREMQPDLILMDIVMPGRQRLPGDAQARERSGDAQRSRSSWSRRRRRRPTASGACARARSTTS